MKVISISLDEELYNKIQKLREEKAINVSKLVRNFLKEVVEKEFKS